jgi:hypothetical protein
MGSSEGARKSKGGRVSTTPKMVLALRASAAHTVVSRRHFEVQSRCCPDERRGLVLRSPAPLFPHRRGPMTPNQPQAGPGQERSITPVRSCANAQWAKTQNSFRRHILCQISGAASEATSYVKLRRATRHVRTHLSSVTSSPNFQLSGCRANARGLKATGESHSP